LARTVQTGLCTRAQQGPCRLCAQGCGWLSDDAHRAGNAGTDALRVAHARALFSPSQLLVLQAAGRVSCAPLSATFVAREPRQPGRVYARADMVDPHFNVLCFALARALFSHSLLRVLQAAGRARDLLSAATTCSARTIHSWGGSFRRCAGRCTF
jgi:hypothetical protein